MSRVLVVDDEPQILRALSINLRARGHDVRTAADGRHALREAASSFPDIVILDLGLPDMDGIEVIRGLRGWTVVPIIVLSGRSGSADKVEALDAGADDYVTKPFGVDELLARLRAVSRRSSPEEAAPTVVIGDNVVDIAAHAVTCRPDSDGKQRVGEEVRLSPTEWALLESLVRHPGKLVSQRQLLADVWGPTAPQDAHYLREYMGRLRRKLERDPSRPRHLLTEPGMGCRFAP